DRPVEESEVVEKALLVGYAEGREGANEVEAVARKRADDVARFPTEVPRRPELDPAVAEPAHRLQHPLRRNQIVAADRSLPDAPGARRTRQTNRSGRRAHEATLVVSDTFKVSDTSSRSARVIRLVSEASERGIVSSWLGIGGAGAWHAGPQ